MTIAEVKELVKHLKAVNRLVGEEVITAHAYPDCVSCTVDGLKTLEMIADALDEPIGYTHYVKPEQKRFVRHDGIEFVDIYEEETE